MSGLRFKESLIISRLNSRKPLNSSLSSAAYLITYLEIVGIID